MEEDQLEKLLSMMKLLKKPIKLKRKIE